MRKRRRKRATVWVVAGGVAVVGAFGSLVEAGVVGSIAVVAVDATFVVVGDAVVVVVGSVDHAVGSWSCTAVGAQTVPLLVGSVSSIGVQLGTGWTCPRE